MSDDLNQDLLLDSRNIADECFELVESLKGFAYPNKDVFLIEEYSRFLQNKSALTLQENLRSLANKTHSLKGVSAFVVPELKACCHGSETVIKPLAALELVYDQPMHALLREFFLWVAGVLQQQETATPTSGGDWSSRFDAEERRAREYVLRNEELIKHLITDRAVEQGATRRRPPTETIAVSRAGYERLLVLANSLHQLATQSNGSAAGRAEGQLSEFLRTHQANKLNPLDLSRYERLVPKLAKQYGLRANFQVDELQMRGEDRFLAAVHEIANHTIKNAVTHGIEPPDVRQKAGKDAEGQIRFRGTEDALNFYVTISDDGRGIDVDKVAARAVELGAVTQERVRAMNRRELLNLVFIQGLSTARVQDDNAGRGIGLNSVQELLDRFQGVCEVDTEAGKGTSWNYRFQKMNVALSCLLVGIQSVQVAVPEHSISTITLDQGDSDKDYARIAEQMVGLIDLENMLGLSRNGTKSRYIVLLRRDDAMVGFRATDVLGKKVLFIQPMPSIVNGINIFAGISIADGKPILVMDAAKVYTHYRNHGPGTQSVKAPHPRPAAPARVEARPS